MSNTVLEQTPVIAIEAVRADQCDTQPFNDFEAEMRIGTTALTNADISAEPPHLKCGPQELVERSLPTALTLAIGEVTRQALAPEGSDLNQFVTAFNSH